VLFALEIEDLKKDKSSTRLLLNPAGELFFSCFILFLVLWCLMELLVIQHNLFSDTNQLTFRFDVRFPLFRFCDSAQGGFPYWSLRYGQKQSTGSYALVLYDMRVWMNVWRNIDVRPTVNAFCTVTLALYLSTLLDFISFLRKERFDVYEEQQQRGGRHRRKHQLFAPDHVGQQHWQQIEYSSYSGHWTCQGAPRR